MFRQIFLPLLLFSLFQTTSTYSETTGSSAPKTKKFVALTIPKSGTHLIHKFLLLLTRLETSSCPEIETDSDWVAFLENNWNKKLFFAQHRKFNPSLADELIERNFKILFLIRDPRDQTISALNWILEGKWLGQFDPNMLSDQLSYEEKLHEAITGERFGRSTLENVLVPHLGWMQHSHPNILVLKYEDLVGSKGGGSDQMQVESLLKIANHIHYPLSKAKAKILAKQLYGGTFTFRNGKIGNWKNIFNEEHKTAFKQKFGQELIDMGYEEDFDW